MTYKIPLSQAWLWIFLSTLMVSGMSWMGWLYYLQLKEKKMQDDRYRIVAIIQSTPHKESLKTIYLAELLNLSIDHPQNLYQFNREKACKRLLLSPLIKQVTLRKIQPGTLYVDYVMRIPIAYLGDYTNTAIDQEGYLFPFSPFFTPKKLPIIYLGLENIDCKWGQSLAQHEGLQLAFTVMKYAQEALDGELAFLKQIDVSQAFADSEGRRQIAILIEEEMEDEEGKNLSSTRSFYVRLNAEDYVHNLANYRAMRKHLGGQKLRVIDMRIPHLAFLKMENES